MVSPWCVVFGVTLNAGVYWMSCHIVSTWIFSHLHEVSYDFSNQMHVWISCHIGSSSRAFHLYVSSHESLISLIFQIYYHIDCSCMALAYSYCVSSHVFSSSLSGQMFCHTVSSWMVSPQLSGTMVAKYYGHKNVTTKSKQKNRVLCA